MRTIASYLVFFFCRQRLCENTYRSASVESSAHFSCSIDAHSRFDSPVPEVHEVGIYLEGGFIYVLVYLYQRPLSL